MTKIWAIADLHLHLANPEKTMSRFGPIWEDHHLKLEEDWLTKVGTEYLVLLGGDLSWASSLEEAKQDIHWVGNLPGHKLLIEGNHDYWWASGPKMAAHLPSSMQPLTEKPYILGRIAIVGTRLWDSPEFVYYPHGDEAAAAKRDKIFHREAAKLERALAAIPPECTDRIAMTHYPPIGPHMEGEIIHQMYLKYGVKLALFGHLHRNPGEVWPQFGKRDGIDYQLISFDYLEGKLLKLALEA